MTIQQLDNVMSPEGGVEKSAGGPTGMFGAAPSAAGRGPGGPGGPIGRPPGRTPGRPPPGMGVPPSPLTSFAKRLDTLKNKTVYLVDIGFGGGYKFMQQLQSWFAENMPSVTTVVKRKSGNVFSDDTGELWEEVKAKGHAVVLGVAG